MFESDVGVAVAAILQNAGRFGEDLAIGCGVGPGCNRLSYCDHGVRQL
jgi:hypothetical protein